MVLVADVLCPDTPMVFTCSLKFVAAVTAWGAYRPLACGVGRCSYRVTDVETHRATSMRKGVFFLARRRDVGCADLHVGGHG